MENRIFTHTKPKKANKIQGQFRLLLALSFDNNDIETNQLMSCYSFCGSFELSKRVNAAITAGWG